MITSTLAFFLGVLALQHLSVLPSAREITIIFGVSCLLVVCWCGLFIFYNCYRHYLQRANLNENLDAKFVWLRTLKILRILLGLVSFFALGFIYALDIAKATASWALPQALEKHNITVTGYICSLPINKPDHTAFEFIAESIVSANVGINANIGASIGVSAALSGVSVYHPIWRLSWYGVRPHVMAGEKWRLVVRLKRPHATLNPNAFDYEQYLWQHKIRAIGYVVGKKTNVNLNLSSQSLTSSRAFSATNYANYYLLRWRQKIENAINAALVNKPLAPMINALVLGDQSGISKEQWQIFRDTGTTYLMAIAGLHICWAAGVVFVFVNYLWRLSSRLLLLLPAREAAAIFGLAAGTLYSALSGFSIPTQRALAMLSVFTCALFMRRHTNSWYALCLALCVVLLVDPLAVLAVGFWLSFVAVVLIFYVTAGRLQNTTTWWRKYARMQWAITIGLAPFTLLFFTEASFVAFISNIVALPAVCSFVVPLAILGSLLLCLLPSPFLGKWVLLLAEKLLEGVWLWLKWFAIFASFNWHHAVANWWIITCALVGVLLLLAPRGFYGKCTGMLWIAPLIFYVPPQPRYGEIWFSVLDVGQGLASVVQTQHHLLIYDAGPKFGDTDAGESVVIPFVRVTGARKVDALVVSYVDVEHSGGARTIMQTLQVDKLLTSAPQRLIEDIKNVNIKNIEVCRKGQEWEWDGVKFAMLFPLAGAIENGNRASCVLRINNDKHAVLLPGDIEKGQERYLLRHEEREQLHATVLVVPHHGAPWASLSEFVEVVNAKYAVFAVGYKNLFHQPAPSVVALYEQYGAKTFQIKDTGAITFKLVSSTDESDVQTRKRAQAQIQTIIRAIFKVTTKASDKILIQAAVPVVATDTILLYRDLLRRYWHD